MWSLRLAPRIGYAVRLGERLLLWPRAGVSNTIVFSSCEPCGDGVWDVQVEAPLVVELAPHLFAGFGPSIFHRPAQGDLTVSFTSYGFRSVLGGWF